MKIPPRDNRVIEDQRIVCCTVQFNLKDPASMRQRVPDCTMHLRNAAKAVGILNSTTLAMSPGDRTSPKEFSKVCRAQQLPGLRSSLMDTRIKGRICPPKRLNTES